LKDRENQLSSLTEQRDLLKANLTEMTNKIQRLLNHSECSSCVVTAHKRNCSEGWKGFFCSCYFFSTQNKTQKESRQDCRDRGAELVIVNNIEEQEFLTNNITADTWIGLSDQDNEGTWKWADDTPLTQGYWEADQPDDWRGEDCVQFGKGKKKEANWNDISCDESLRWICEK
uniref:C-type lectin domain-containing protein n=1 Tax=Labrus bergylta TaxID=56723 RepID=A0A3Q3FE95_9LABR